MIEQPAFPSVVNASFVSTPSLDDASFVSWREYLRPSAEELQWQKVPWRPSFWEGVLEAQQKERPLLIWAMNGHPLACT